MSYMEPNPSMNLEDLLAILAEQYALQGGGLQGDPNAYAPQGGFPSPPMPNGKMGQYRTQGSGFLSDGTVRDLLGKVLPNQDQFSADQFFGMDPALKPIAARAVSEGGHDPFSVYALADDPDYQRALIDAAARSGGLDPIEVGAVETDTNGDSLKDVQDLSASQYRALADEQYAGKIQNKESGGVNMYGDAVMRPKQYGQVLDEKLGGLQTGLEDFITQAAPSEQRLSGELYDAWDSLGGMPFPGMDPVQQGEGGPAYGDVLQAMSLGLEGKGFKGGAFASPEGLQDDPEAAPFVEAFLRANGVDIEGNRNRRDDKIAKINAGVRAAREGNVRRAGERAIMGSNFRRGGSGGNGGNSGGRDVFQTPMEQMPDDVRRSNRSGRTPSGRPVRRPTNTRNR